jgi:hypothetical protein
MALIGRAWALSVQGDRLRFLPGRLVEVDANVAVQYRAREVAEFAASDDPGLVPAVVTGTPP